MELHNLKKTVSLKKTPRNLLLLSKAKLISVFGKKKVWDEKLEGLFAPEGPVHGTGTSNKGYLYFKFCREWEASKEVLDEIYVQFSEYAAKNGIPELPVVFKWAD